MDLDSLLFPIYWWWGWVLHTCSFCWLIQFELYLEFKNMFLNRVIDPTFIQFMLEFQVMLLTGEFLFCYCCKFFLWIFLLSSLLCLQILLGNLLWTFYFIFLVVNEIKICVSPKNNNNNKDLWFRLNGFVLAFMLASCTAQWFLHRCNQFACKCSCLLIARLLWILI